ncbi:MAG: acyl-CoA dehydrogenase [Nitrospinota bacterium]|nr:MAG: acyl-CoA dehydrogenase [Nitrospinota bacterium]
MKFILSPEQEMLRKMVRELAEKEFRPRAARWDREEAYPWENVEPLVQAGLMGMTIPPEYGGGGKGVLETIIAAEEIARVCGVTARLVVEGNLGTVGVLVHYGSEAQKRKYLPWICQGEKPAIAITEPEAGSAATDLQTTAELDGDHYVLNGTKCFITGAGVSRLYLVFARFNRVPGARGIGALLVEKGTPGFSFGRRTPMMGLRGIPEGELIFTGCRVPRENLIVEPGEGFKRLMQAYNGQRCGAAAVALGIAQGAFDLAVRYTQERRQFGRELADFQGIQWMLADMAIALEAGRLLLYRAAAAAGGTLLPPALETAMAKTYIGEMAVEVTNTALQIHGGYGYSRDLPLERMVRDARMFTIGGGTAQMLRTLIASQVLGRKISQRKE